jgi:hypothetical protein
MQQTGTRFTLGSGVIFCAAAWLIMLRASAVPPMRHLPDSRCQKTQGRGHACIRDIMSSTISHRGQVENANRYNWCRERPKLDEG